MYYDERRRDKPGDYFPLPKVIFHLGLNAGEIAVFAYLMYCEDRKMHQCHPSKAEMLANYKKYLEGKNEAVNA